MKQLTLAVPDSIYDEILQQAQEIGQTPEEFLLAILQEEFALPGEDYENDSDG